VKNFKNTNDLSVSMGSTKAVRLVKDLLARAHISVQGKKPADIIIHNPKLYSSVLHGGTLALGESYIDGWWDCKALDQFFTKVLDAHLERVVTHSPAVILEAIKGRIFNLQRGRRAYHIGKHHYDVGNELYTLMLGKTMAYSCGYWKDAKNLDEAQEAKYDLICKKLKLKPGMRLLDIGSGWGGLIFHAAKHYGVSCVGITVSREQQAFAIKKCKGLRVTTRYQRWQDLDETEQFDRIVSVGAIEHFGHKNYRKFMHKTSRLLKPGGIFVLHTIGSLTSSKSGDPWISKYIFPNSMLPSVSQLTKAAEGIFALKDFQEFGRYYDHTLMAWHHNFNSAWATIKKSNPLKYDERFFRMWNYYLLSCAAGFRTGYNQLWQFVFTKDSAMHYIGPR
jgi:cyclopropane-fatty-acyl-phospholipid synthase